MSAVDLSAVKDYLQIDGSAHDGKLQRILDAAEAAIARRVGPLSPTTVTARVSGGPTFLLPTFPVLSLTSVADSAGTTVPLSGVDVDLAAGTVFGAGGASLRSPSYTIVYQAGRDPVPDDLVMALLELVRHMWETQRGPVRRPGSSTSESASNTIPGAAYLFPFRVEQLLAPHELPAFA